MKKIFALSLFLVAAVFAAKPETKPTLVFFMNPNGRPCQMQDEMLTKAKADLEKTAVVRYVKTTVPADRDAFYEYGVRSLPQLILVDEKGNPVHRFAPGIQEMDVIMQAIIKK